MRFRRVVILPLFGLALALFACGAQAADPAQELSAKVQERYGQIKAISADYTRTSHFQGLAGEAPRVTEAVGRLDYLRPLSLKLDQLRPKPETVLADGKVVWWTRQNRERADVYPLSDFTSGLNSLLSALSGLSNLEAEFELIPANPAEAEYMEKNPGLVLKPRKSMGDLARLAVWFDESGLLLKGFASTNLLGDVTIWRFENMQPNPEFASDYFSYSPPEGWRIVDHRPKQ